MPRTTNYPEWVITQRCECGYEIAYGGRFTRQAPDVGTPAYYHDDCPHRPTIVAVALAGSLEDPRPAIQEELF